MKVFRCICFDCRSYCIPIKQGELVACNMCESQNLAKVGNAFRPPRKNHVSGWKKLEKVYACQNTRFLERKATAVKNGANEEDLEKMGLNKSKTDYLSGFGGSRYRWIKKGSTIPKNLKESGYLQAIGCR